VSRTIKTGIEVGETIIVSGLQRAFPGAPVTPVDLASKAAADEHSPAKH